MARPKPSAPQWQPGQSGNPKGRPIGSRNKLNETEKVRETRPEIYL
jgi:Family of unknown function (DUF5681)